MAKQTVQLNYLRIAPRKVRALAGVIRGMSINDAEAQLMHERRRPAGPLLKLMRSAITAAKAKKLAPEKLFIETITVDQGPMLRRSLPRARGMASLIQKKMSHVTLTLAERENTPSPRYTIIVKKKEKKPEGNDRPRKRRKIEPEAESEKTKKQAEQPGFFKRVFRRKSV